MPTATKTSLPLADEVAPATQDELVAAVQLAVAKGMPVYPIGGGTSLDFGLPARRPGLGLATTGLDRIVDYPARDMTITCEAGLTVARLAHTLATERQWLPIDVPQADRATLGGVVATNFSGPRRYGQGTIRDYLIGVRAVDGRGEVYSGGGRVVKNVAGYDFCKMLTGSLGTLGVITQMTFKVKPRPEASALVACDINHFGLAEPLLDRLVASATTPTAIELVAGPYWDSDAKAAPPIGQESRVLHQPPGPEVPDAPAWARLIVGLEGTAQEVDWMCATLADEWRPHGVERVRTFRDAQAESLWSRLTEFPALLDAPLVLKASVPPGRLVKFLLLVREIDPECSVQAHAGDGVLVVRFAKFEPGDVGRVLVGKLQATAAAWEGSAIVLSASGLELTRQATWGGRAPAHDMMEAIRRQFDPQGLLNPGRYLYES